MSAEFKDWVKSLFIKANPTVVFFKDSDMWNWAYGNENVSALDAWEHQQKEITTLKSQLEKAEAVVRFYASEQNWFNSGNQKINRIKVSDLDIQSFKRDGFNYCKVETGGKRARDYIRELK